MGGRIPHAEFTKSRRVLPLSDLINDDCVGFALAYATGGLSVFPVYPIRDDGRCGCGRDCVRNAGKHPLADLAPRGLLDATTDRVTVGQWWALWPDANVGVRTGHGSGLWVLDVDPDKGGEAAIAALEAAHGALPPTWAVETGGGGLHLWWRHPGSPVPTSAGKLGQGLDVRGEGGYVVAPPSRHRSGARYAWGADWAPGRVPLAPAPPWLLTLVTTPNRVGPPMVPPVPRPIKDAVGGNNPAGAGTRIEEGQRNAVLTSLAGAMRRRGFGEAAILAALLAENAERCVPPLDPTEVAKVARSVARYAPEPAPPARARRRTSFVEFVGGRAVAR